MLPWFTKYPNQNDEILNLDWVITQLENLKAAYEAFLAANSLTFANPITWDITKQYSKNTIVLSPEGDAYLSKKVVGKGIQLNNTDYWLEIFNFAEYVRTANSNLTMHIEQNTTRATAAYAVDDWLLWEDVLYKVTAAIAVDDLLTVGTNIVHFTVEDFCRAWQTYMVNTIAQYKADIDASELAYKQQLDQTVLQYKNDIDASELAYKNQLDASISYTTSSLQAQLNAAITGATVDSEVINARVDINNITHATLRDAIIAQIEGATTGSMIRNKAINALSLDIFDTPVNLYNPDDYVLGWIQSDGSILSGTQRTTGFIPVDEGDILQVGWVFPAGSPSADHQSIFSWCAFDKNYNVTHHFTVSNETSITCQSGDAYVRMSLNPSYFGANVIIYKNSTDMPAYEPFKLKIKSKYVNANYGNFLIVDPNNVNAYQTISSAITDATTGDVILVFPATYNEVINVSKDFTLIGLDREKCILQSTSPEYNNTPLYVSGNINIENLTVKMNAASPSATRNGYALHTDKAGAGTMRFRNCIFYNNVGAALGAGGQQDQYSYYEDCTFISDVAETSGTPDTNYDGYGAVFFHAPTATPKTNCGAQFKDCIFTSTVNRVFTLSSVQDVSLMYLRFINNLAFSKYNKKTNVVHYNATTYLKIDEMSYGNSTSELDAT